MNRVCADYREWQKAVPEPGRIAMNLSLRQLKQSSFIARCRNVFRKHGVSPTCFELEVTETTLMTDPKRTIGLLNELYAMGLNLAIDDFGTGYSSLSALQQFPIGTLKIDQSFVRDVAVDTNDAAIVRTIIDMGKSLDLEVIAEGVEESRTARIPAQSRLLLRARPAVRRAHGGQQTAGDVGIAGRRRRTHTAICACRRCSRFGFLLKDLSMLSARDLTLRRGPQPLFTDVNFTIFRGNKVGITGANGAGKSSLFAAVRGQLGADRGEIERARRICASAMWSRKLPPKRAPPLNSFSTATANCARVQAAIAAAEQRDEPIKLAELYTELESIDGYRAAARAAAVMHGLGFKAKDHQRTVAEFSGGWRVRLGMARALCSRADLLLLDEPTNHLDLDAILWLEQWLKDFAGTLLMISHDREFLDAIIDRVLHIENRKISGYSGNYSQFETKRAEELALQTLLQARQARRIAEITTFVNRFRASATKSRQAQSRLKMLERMERIVPAHVDSPFEFDFAPPLKTPRPLLTLENASCGYGAPVVSGIDLTISPLDRIALLGPNGAGKSTFTKLLAGEMRTLGGRRIAAADLNVGYFAQQQLEQLKVDCDAFWHLRNLGGADFAAGDEQKVRDHLGRFGFEGDRAFEPVQRFSGGEKARLTLALLVARRPNLLLLDEPTNHLDIDMRHALTVALQSFEGGLVVVSHDRHLIKSAADTLLLVADGKLTAFEGDLDDYQRWLRSRDKSSATAAVKAPQRDTPKVQRAAKVRDPLAKLRLQLQNVEQRIANSRPSARYWRAKRNCWRRSISKHGAPTSSATRRSWKRNGWTLARPSRLPRQRPAT